MIDQFGNTRIRLAAHMHTRGVKRQPMALFRAHHDLFCGGGRAPVAVKQTAGRAPAAVKQTNFKIPFQRKNIYIDFY